MATFLELSEFSLHLFFPTPPSYLRYGVFTSICGWFSEDTVTNSSQNRATSNPLYIICASGPLKASVFDILVKKLWILLCYGPGLSLYLISNLVFQESFLSLLRPLAIASMVIRPDLSNIPPSLASALLKSYQHLIVL